MYCFDSMPYLLVLFLHSYSLVYLNEWTPFTKVLYTAGGDFKWVSEGNASYTFGALVGIEGAGTEVFTTTATAAIDPTYQ